MTNQATFKHYFPIFQGISFIVLAISTGNRSFVIGYLFSTFLLLLLSKKIRLNKFVFLSILAMVTAILAFFFKTDSSFGRLLIYKICSRILFDAFPFGIGLGKFEKVYGEYQAAYFQMGNFTEKELLLADNTRFAFNDYLQFLIETGVWGGLFLLLAGFIISSLVRKAYRKVDENTLLLNLAIVNLFAIFTAALFTHVFDKSFFQIICFASLATISYHSFQMMKTRRMATIAAVTIGVMIILYFHYGSFFIHKGAYAQYKKAWKLGQAGYLEQSANMCENVYPYLNKDVSFVNYYTSVLISTGRYKAAIPPLKKLLLKSNSVSFHLKLAACYQKTYQWENAEECYLKAIYMVPNRFTSRYYLFDFYDKTLQVEKAKTEGENLLHLPVKFHSVQIEQLKADVGQRMKKLAGK